MYIYIYIYIYIYTYLLHPRQRLQQRHRRPSEPKTGREERSRLPDRIACQAQAAKKKLASQKSVYVCMYVCIYVYMSFKARATYKVLSWQRSMYLHVYV